MRRKMLLCLVGTGLFVTSYAQRDVICDYQNTMGDNMLIYSGKIEKIYASSFYFNRPYLESDDYFPGEITYGHNWYGNLSLRFDLLQEQLVALTPEKKVGVELDMRKITRFIIGKRTFVHADCLPAGMPEQGYVHLLSDGEKIKLLVKHRCITKAAVLKDNASYMSFGFKDKYYIYTRGSYYLMKNKKLFYKLFPQYRRQLGEFAREAKLDFKKEREQSFFRMAEYLQTLVSKTPGL